MDTGKTAAPRGTWKLVRLPAASREPWMVAGRDFEIELKRTAGALTKPDVLVFDRKTGKQLATLAWELAVQIFDVLDR